MIIVNNYLTFVKNFVNIAFMTKKIFVCKVLKRENYFVKLKQTIKQYTIE